MDDSRYTKKIYTPHQAKLKAENYCAYQERAQQEVRDKLYEWGLHFDDVENIISELISENFLNEERFAKAYASGKFRINSWGKVKIRQYLKLKKIPEKLIKSAISTIDSEEYDRKISHLIDLKTKGEKKPYNLKLKTKLYNYLATKGYENDIIFQKIHKDT
ncbi:RecX family transcriptional regulator [Sphingobacterium olei]|uniref:Regulatory protein RecX n=1 Tax=Sphingobacterium olei TaxID=2571155 RepID=A0A4U0NHH4_9SPHI|nr:regulatory protein RecX [Sphingobacterium olei]TJZ53639.1 RecX family transcriptional regulator [Sphingobacterium olei]